MENRTFYCDKCANERRWPTQITRVPGICEQCNKQTLVNGVSREVIPKPAEVRSVGFNQLTLEFKEP